MRFRFAVLAVAIRLETYARTTNECCRLDINTMEEFEMVGRRTEPGKVFLEERGHGALGDDDGGVVQTCGTNLGLSL